ncbi:MAG: GNAT family N-acetyltransferase [Solirubrobacterales bacterium]|nr:GNAT family N-acetyltransferase [Solirubrobacterales bacterium]
MSDASKDPSSKPLGSGVVIRPAARGEAEELLPLMRAYCDFYEVTPVDEGLLEMARTLAVEPEHGALFIARDGAGGAVGFAALSWKWAGTRGARIGFLEDLFVAPSARGAGVAEALIESCSALCRQRGAPVLEWLTAPTNKRAQSVYERIGAEGSPWIGYELDL